MDKNFPERLISLRKRCGLSQEQLGDKLFVSRQAVSKWECGESVPDIENLSALAKLFGISLDELVNGALPVDGAPSPAERPAADTLRAEYEITLPDNKKHIRQFYFHHAKRWLFPAILLLLSGALCIVLGYTVANGDGGIAAFGFAALGFGALIFIINGIAVYRSVKMYTDAFKMSSVDGKAEYAVERTDNALTVKNLTRGDIATYGIADFRNAVIYKDVIIAILTSKLTVLFPNTEALRAMLDDVIESRAYLDAKREKKKRVGAAIGSAALFLVATGWTVGACMPFITDTAYYRENNTVEYTATIERVEVDTETARYEIYLQNSSKHLRVDAAIVKDNVDVLGATAVGDTVVYRVRRIDEKLYESINIIDVCALTINGTPVLTLERSTEIAKQGFVPIWIVLPILDAVLISIEIYILIRTFRKRDKV